MEPFLDRLAELDADDFARLAAAHSAARRRPRDPAYVEGRAKLTRLDTDGALGLRISDAAGAAMRDAGYTGLHSPALAAIFWAGLAEALRDELDAAEYAALTASWAEALAPAGVEA